MSKEEFAQIVTRRVLLLVSFAAIAILLAWGVGATFSEGVVGLRALGLVLDAFAALVLAGATLTDKLAMLHKDSLAPSAHSTTHAEQTVIDLRRTTDHVTGLLLLVVGFAMQLPSAMG